MDSLGGLVIDQRRYAVGDAVNVHSLLSDEEFSGTLTVVDSEEVILRVESGPRFSFPLSLIRAARYS